MTPTIPWWEPRIAGRERELIGQVLDDNYLNDGEWTGRFERAIAERTGARHAIACTSGTMALFLAVAAVGAGAGDEVIVPDLTFIASANAVLLAGAKPVLVDVDPRSLTVDPAAVERAITPRTRAIMPVHVSGRSADMVALQAIAKRHGVALVEDAAEALLSFRRGRHLGTFGALGCLSFSPNKSITTGQGGMVLTDDPALAQRVRELKDQGRPVRGTGGDDPHPTIGFNFKFTNLQAAVGLAQLDELDARVERQRRIYEIYRERLAGVAGIRLPGFEIEDGERPLWTDAVVERRDALDRHLSSRGMHCRRFWHPLHHQPPYRDADDRFPNTVAVAPKALWLPSAFTNSDDDTARVADEIRGFLAGAGAR